MFTRSVISMALAASLAAGAPVLAYAAGAHSHAGASTKLEVKLNQGRKWASDDALRGGMGQIRQDMAAALPKIHKGKLNAAEYDALSGKVQAQVDHITANCKLPEDADLVLHAILEQILDGIGSMKGPERRSAGAVKVVEALNVYGKTFEHPGWKPVAH